MKNKKSLGQHWLKDRAMLFSIADSADLCEDDTVLEIGPGLGTLTSVLLKRAGKVVAVEFDSELAMKLPGQFPGKNLEVVNDDILSFNLENLPVGYKVVANVPYYITSKIVRVLLETTNKPSVVVLLVQKEVAERLAAEAGDLSILGISAQVYSKVSLGYVIDKSAFTPPPKVDSQVVRFDIYAENKLRGVDEKEFFRLVKIGFSSPRKKLVSNLANGLKLDRAVIESTLNKLDISLDVRPEGISIENWKEILVSLK
jgi:dimethyladenosine transferase